MSDNIFTGGLLIWILRGVLTIPFWFKSLSIPFHGLAIWPVCLVSAKIIFDMTCLLMNSSIVRRKVFKPYKTKRMTIILTILLSFSGADCPSGFVRHSISSKEVCCRFIACSPGTFVQPCQHNMTSDVCLPCAATSYLLDSTNSSFPYPCIKTNCPPRATTSTAFTRYGCRLRCKCDEERGYYGKDPCNCKRIVDKTNKQRKEQADYPKMRENLMFHHNHKQIKLVFIVVAIAFGLVILTCFLYLYCELQRKRSKASDAGPASRQQVVQTLYSFLSKTCYAAT